MNTSTLTDTNSFVFGCLDCGTPASCTFFASTTGPHPTTQSIASIAARPRDIMNMIEELRSTPAGEVAWNQVQRDRAHARREAKNSGQLSKIRYWRMEKGLTQRELAIAMKSQQSDISRYERPSYRAGRRTLEKVAKALRISISELL